MGEGTSVGPAEPVGVGPALVPVVVPGAVGPAVGPDDGVGPEPAEDASGLGEDVDVPAGVEAVSDLDGSEASRWLLTRMPRISACTARTWA